MSVTTSPSLTTWILAGLATALGLIYIWPTFGAAASGWIRLRQRYGISRVDQPAAQRGFRWTSIWLSQRWPALDAQGGGDLWPVTATVSEAGLYLRVQHTFGKLAQPVLIPWTAMEDAEAPEGYHLGLALPEIHVDLGLRGKMADAVTGYRRWARRNAGTPGPAA
jgi:hypothetical protein